MTKKSNKMTPKKHRPEKGSAYCVVIVIVVALATYRS